MGVDAGINDRDGTLDIFKTNFAGDTSSLYATRKSLSRTHHFRQVSASTPGVSVGASSFVDIDNDSWLDHLLINGHVYPEVDETATNGYRQRKVSIEISATGGSSTSRRSSVRRNHGRRPSGRGCATADFGQRRRLDVVVNCVNATPELCRLRLRQSYTGRAEMCRNRSNRDAIGRAGHALGRRANTRSRKYAAAAATFRRTIFGCTSASARRHEWTGSSFAGLTGADEQWTDVPINRIVTLTEGTGAKEAAK